MVDNAEAKKYYLDLVAACRQIYSSERAVSSWEMLQGLIETDNVHFKSPEFYEKYLDLICASFAKLLKDS